MTFVCELVAFSRRKLRHFHAMHNVVWEENKKYCIIFSYYVCRRVTKLQQSRTAFNASLFCHVLRVSERPAAIRMKVYIQFDLQSTSGICQVFFRGRECSNWSFAQLKSSLRCHWTGNKTEALLVGDAWPHMFIDDNRRCANRVLTKIQRTSG